MFLTASHRARRRRTPGEDEYPPWRAVFERVCDEHNCHRTRAEQGKRIHNYSVTAPSDAEVTSLTYFAMTPEVYFGAGACHFSRRCAISSSLRLTVRALRSASMVIMSPFCTIAMGPPTWASGAM